MCKRGNSCFRCGNEITEEANNPLNQGRKIYYCKTCREHIFKLGKKYD